MEGNKFKDYENISRIPFKRERGGVSREVKSIALEEILRIIESNFEKDIWYNFTEIEDIILNTNRSYSIDYLSENPTKNKGENQRRKRINYGKYSKRILESILNSLVRKGKLRNRSSTIMGGKLYALPYQESKT